MKFSTQTVSMNPPILKRKLGGELFVPVTLASTAFSNGVCFAYQGICNRKCGTGRST